MLTPYLSTWLQETFVCRRAPRVSIQATPRRHFCLILWPSLVWMFSLMILLAAFDRLEQAATWACLSFRSVAMGLPMQVRRATIATASMETAAIIAVLSRLVATAS